jgi:endonuclease I/V8-like Glu-specific endopeptidase
MLPPYPLIQETIERYKQSTKSRESNTHKLESGSLFNVDTQERVNRRLERIARNPVATAILSEAKISPEALSEEEFKRVILERVIGQRDLMSIAYLEYGLWASRSVCRIVLRGRSGRVLGYGTGFLVSPRLLMTNNHVLSSLEEAQTALAEFNYQSSTNGEMLATVAYELNPLTFFITSQPLDYSLVAIKEKQNFTPLGNFGWNPLIEEQGKVILGEYVNIIQHPGGEPKQLALRENQVINLLEDFVHYQTDTAPGSSGSPVFNDQWEVVALHHSGVPKMDERGNFLAIDGSIWTEAMGEEQLDWIGNEGVRISRIIQDIKQKENLTPVQRQLRSQLFDGGQPTVSIKKDGSESSTTVISEQQIDSGVVTWTIPLKVSIGLGTLGLPVSPSATTSGKVNNELPELPPIEDEFPSIDRDPEIQAELKQLKLLERGEIPYYDADRDDRERDRYYSSLLADLNFLSPKQLFERLKQLLKETHRNQLGYKPVAYLYPWVDLQPNLKIRSIYSQLEYTPEQIIQEDLSIERMRSIRLRSMIQTESLSPLQFQERIDLLERDFPYNCEHVVPQSWFDKAQPMKGDLHHLFACESKCNSFRGNNPYTDFADFNEATKSDCGKLEGKKFEPGFGKGEVARATLYFLLRYPGFINNRNDEYQPQSLETLLDWHQNYPVTQHERHRNLAIDLKQGNRNPLIDFPDWAKKIDFQLGLG